MQGLRYRSHYIAQLNESLIGKSVTVAGWIEDVRDIGRLVFVVIRDTTGTVQTIARGENVSIAKDIPRQSSVIVSGTLKKSDARDYPVEISIQDLQVFSRAIYPLPIDATGRVGSSTGFKEPRSKYDFQG